MSGLALKVLALGEIWSAFKLNELETRTAVGITL
jgi:hypothetical protein